ncbi:hypothetical protein [Thalassospira xiamenensis]|uniref:Glutamine amidotransferase domain-containing protein n=1 Tax=Thalassospira xiamenensis TaxID=220697 RepID=A0A367XFV6_9PROT|nr:hypothetical protein [Thalassospira xiamenensis]KZB56745.1 hypothetical protein AUP41_13985 [Thalassospira xiamenensis]MCK2166956.1 hypothetical protein [Thalassospira xiamenensis]RCK51990.1 hypothetical protein TH44_06160 [Thalassospira xiamenensis]
MNRNWQDFQIAPLLDIGLLQILAVICVAAILLFAVFRLRGTIWRTIVMVIMLLALIAPQFTDQNREKLSDIILVLVDRSSSQNIGSRMDQTDAAISQIRNRFADDPSIELRIEEVPGETDTRMFSALDRLLGGIPRERLGGVVMITDGQIHDIPANLDLGAPLHALITGREDERDRRLQIRQTADYGIVGKNADFMVEAIDHSLATGSPVSVRMLHEDGSERNLTLPANEPHRVTIPVPHAGPVIAELRMEESPNETDQTNNRLILETTGVRDRLRVLLLSGEPHPGERAWRNLLRADPGVDLVHFTILRPPEKGDDTPINELALIPFPIRDLFEVRLRQFDLIIFDRYQMRGVLPPHYLEKVVDYVKWGGAALVVAGPEYLGPDGLSNTVLGDLMPVRVTGRVIEQPFVPQVNTAGRIHPVTAPIAGSVNTPPKWGHWYRQIETREADNNVMTLLTGADQLPLLSLRRVEEGRAAMLSSDQMWLWQRGHDGGGPIAEMLRRLSHWLMKEPALDENTITTERSADVKSLTLTWRKIGAEPTTATGANPETGEVVRTTFERQSDQTWQATLPIAERGLIRVQTLDREGSTQSALHVDRDVLTNERRNTNSTPDLLRDLVLANGGYIDRIEKGLPDFRRVEDDRIWNGTNWAGLMETESYRTVIGGITNLLPLPVVAVLLGLMCLIGWRTESK